MLRSSNFSEFFILLRLKSILNQYYILFLSFSLSDFDIWHQTIELSRNFVVKWPIDKIEFCYYNLIRQILKYLRSLDNLTMCQSSTYTYSNFVQQYHLHTTHCVEHTVQKIISKPLFIIFESIEDISWRKSMGITFNWAFF